MLTLPKAQNRPNRNHIRGSVSGANVCVCVCVIKAQKEVRMGNYFIRHGSRKPSSILRNSSEYDNLLRALGFATITSWYTWEFSTYTLLYYLGLEVIVLDCETGKTELYKGEQDNLLSRSVIHTEAFEII